MPGYKGHILGATLVNAAYIGGLATFFELHDQADLTTDLELLAGLFVLAILFGLFPDIDTNSKGQDIFYGLAFLMDIVLILNGYYEAAAFFGLIAIVPILGKHRGWTHSKWAMLLIPSFILALSYAPDQHISETAWIVYGAAVAGYFSHLLLDGCITKRIRFKGR